VLGTDGEGSRVAFPARRTSLIAAPITQTAVFHPDRGRTARCACVYNQSKRRLDLARRGNDLHAASRRLRLLFCVGGNRRFQRSQELPAGISDAQPRSSRSTNPSPTISSFGPHAANRRIRSVQSGPLDYIARQSVRQRRRPRTDGPPRPLMSAGKRAEPSGRSEDSSSLPACADTRSRLTLPPALAEPRGSARPTRGENWRNDPGPTATHPS
jgi:hypothetical protein